MLRIALVFAVTICLSSAALAERRVALVFGADEYRHIRPLKNAVNDARAMEDALAALGFEVFSEANRDLRRMRRALDDFRLDAEGADVALIYFAGHGVEVAGQNRLLPVDTDIASLERLNETSLPLEELRETVNAVARIGLIVLDACRNDPFWTLPGEDGRGAISVAPQVVEEARPGLGRMGRAENVLFAFSAAPGEVAADGLGSNSPFTAGLTKYLGTDGLEFRSVLTLVQQEVYDLSGGRQLPYVESGLPALFFAARTGDLPERERLLLAMADVTPAIRDEVERVAAGHDMPLAPLYAALVSENLSALSPQARGEKLAESARAFVKVRDDLRTLSSSDPQVTALRDEAEKQLALGAVATALERLDEAAAVDAASRTTLMANYVGRTLSEAATHALAGGTARTDLRHARALADYERAAALYEEVDEASIPADNRQRHLDALFAIGDIHLVIGQTDLAAQAFARRLALVERLDALEPRNLRWERELVVSRLAVGDVELRRGNLRAAREAFDAAIPLAEWLATALPDSLPLRRDLAAAHASLGNAHLLQHEAGEARRAHQAAFALYASLADAAPQDAMAQRDLSLAHVSLGDVDMLDDARAAAVEAYRQALAIRRALAEADPENRLWQQDIAFAQERVGDAMRRDEPDGALTAYGEALAIRETLAAADPENRDLLHSLSALRGKIADIRRDMGDIDGALAGYRAGLALQEELAAADPGNAALRRNVLVLHDRIGRVRTRQGELLAQAGDLAGAVEAHAEALAMREAIAAASPGDLGVQHALFGDLVRLIEARQAAGDALGAIVPTHAALRIAKALVAAEPDNASWRWSLFTAHWLSAQFVGTGAVQYRQALAVLEAMETDGQLEPWQAEWLDHTRARLAETAAAE